MCPRAPSTQAIIGYWEPGDLGWWHSYIVCKSGDSVKCGLTLPRAGATLGELPDPVAVMSLGLPHISIEEGQSASAAASAALGDAVGSATHPGGKDRGIPQPFDGQATTAGEGPHPSPLHFRTGSASGARKAGGEDSLG